MNAGSDAPVSLTFTNHSPQAFFGLTRFIPTDLAPLLVATDDPINRSSQFHHPTWFSANRPCAEFSIKKLRPGRPDAISTGDQATATFMLRAPAVAGTYRERFTLVVEGVDSLADELSFNLTIDVI